MEDCMKECGATEPKPPELTIKEVAEKILNAMQEQTDNLYRQIYELRVRVASLEEDRNMVVEKHIRLRMLPSENQKDCAGEGRQSGISRLRGELRRW